MTKSEIFKKAWQVARETRDQHANLKAAFAVALRGVYASLRVDLETRITAAYVKVTGERYGRMAMLCDIRRELSDVTREALDAKLLEIHCRDGEMYLSRSDDMVVDLAHRADAIQISGEYRCSLWIS